MKQTKIEWRKATELELQNGASEMIKVSEVEIEVPDIVEEKTDLSKIDIDSLTDEQIIKLKERFSRL